MPRAMFFSTRLQGASVDEIAEAASAGKPTIYARFPNKQAFSPPSSTASCAETRVSTRFPALAYQSSSGSTRLPPLS